MDGKSRSVVSGTSDEGSLSTTGDYDHDSEYARIASPHGLGVDVEKAEHDFAELSRRFSNISHHASRLSKQESRISKSPMSTDLEKAGTLADSEERWDLETALRGNRVAEVEAGIKSKHIGMLPNIMADASLLTGCPGVIWDNLTVRGMGGVKTFVKTFPDAVVDFFNVPETIMNLLGYGKKGKQFDILKDFRGVMKPGEMVLVLGKPGSGCTSFLKAITNQRFGFIGVDGEVLYGPFDAQTFSKRFRGEAVYNQEDDVHEPTLTVKQTLGFALDTKTPGKRPLGVSKQEFKEKVIDLLLKMFNIEHTANTVVGNQFIRYVCHIFHKPRT